MKRIICFLFIFGGMFYSSNAQKKIKEVGEANNHFAWDVYQKLSDKEKGNLFFSPFSISSALAMTYAGAKDETAKEMETVLHWTSLANQVHEQYKQLMAQLTKQQDGEDVQLNVANALWGEKSFTFLDSFTQQLKNFYNSDMHKMDYKKKTEESRKEINTWVEKQTRDKIKELLPKGVIKDDTRLVLTNALYFKAIWANIFTDWSTQKGDFWVSKDKKEQTDLMNITKHFRYKEAHGAQILEMPYKNNQFSMVFILPKSKAELADWEKKLTFEKYADLISMEGAGYSEVITTIPKFKITTAFSMKDMLKSMGMKISFTDDADFSGMTGKKDMKIDDVIHKAYIEVMEKGTEAAAATAVIMAEITSSVHEDRPTPKIFKADHPFMFAIKDNTSGTILFMGKYVKP